MQEVVKRMQERQAPKIKQDEYYGLYIVRSNDQMHLVVLPTSCVSVGDIVWYPLNGITIEGEVIFDGYCRPDSDLWTGLMVAMQTEPILGVKYAHSIDATWKEEKE